MDERKFLILQLIYNEQPMTPTLLNVPGIQFTRIKPYQHRIRETFRSGYHGHITEGGHVHTFNRYTTTVKVFRGWRIGFRNTSKDTVAINMRFSIHDNYGKKEDFGHLYENLRPGEPAEIVVHIQDKNFRVLFEAVDVYAQNNEQLLSTTEVKQFLPRLGWNMKSWAVALIMTLFTLMALNDPAPANPASVLLPVLSLFIMILGLMNITPVFMMLLVVLLAPLSPYGPGVKTTIILLGLTYFFWIWRQRHSFKDFIRATSTASQ